MPRSIAIDELSTLLGILAHPDRIRLIEILKQGESDVNALSERLELSQARVSQHLSLLKSHHLVRKRKEGRHAYYNLYNVKIADWLLVGLDFVEVDLRHRDEVHKDLKELRSKWGKYG